MLCPNMSTIIRSEGRVMNAGEGLIITKWNTAQSAFTNLIESYEYIKLRLVLKSTKGEVNDCSVLMTEIRRLALPSSFESLGNRSGVWM